MQSSRIFVKNLPPNITESDFRKHFAVQGRQVTDVKLYPSRRIGFIGYKSAEDAAWAVKYFNKTFIRLSRIAVDLAKPIADSIPKNGAKLTPANGSARISLHNAPASGIGQAEDGNSKKRKREEPAEEADPKLREFLEVMGHTSKKLRDQDVPSAEPQSEPVATVAGGESDDEYDDVAVRKKSQSDNTVGHSMPSAARAVTAELPIGAPPPEELKVPVPPPVPADTTDDDWLRSRTNRLLDLVDPDDPQFPIRPVSSMPAAATALKAEEHPPGENAVLLKPDKAGDASVKDKAAEQHGSMEDAIATINKTRRLFLRNLSYTTTEDDLREHFSRFGALEEVNLPLDNQNRSKGFAMIRFEKPEAAVAAFQLDGSTFQGRLLHILPAAPKREFKLDEFALSKLPLKKQLLLKKKAEAASSTFNWNSLFMSQDAVNTAVAERLGISKHELLDPTDASAAVKQAIAETSVIQEAKTYFAKHGVNIEAFKNQQRGDTVILVKNIKNTTAEELRDLFAEHGSVLRVLMPPSGTIAIVQFAQPAACRAAFAKKAYSRFKDSVLFLEKGPKGLFTDTPPLQQGNQTTGVQKLSAAELLARDDAEEESTVETSSLYVRNLNFSTTSEGLANAFKHLDGFVSATVKTKPDPKKPGQVLSMGFGFCVFRTKEQAQAALKAMDGTVLDGYKLVIKASHRGLDAAEERRREDLAKKAAVVKRKIVIKNLPFQATKKDIRDLFGTYGKLVAVRVPKKFNSQSRGFAFAEFATAKEALNALTALKDTHLLGRRLVLDFAEADEVDPEEQIKAMEKKTRDQLNKVTLQQLTGGGRKKINIGGDHDEDER